MTYGDTKYKATLYDPLTDQRIEYLGDYDSKHKNEALAETGDSMNFLRFLWEEGNYSCDCNRLEFMGIDDDAECGQRVILETLEWVNE